MDEQLKKLRHEQAVIKEGLYREICNSIERYTKEFDDVEYIVVIGILETIKAELIFQHFQAE